MFQNRVPRDYRSHTQVAFQPGLTPKAYRFQGKDVPCEINCILVFVFLFSWKNLKVIGI